MKPTDSAKQADDATEQAAKALNPLDKAAGSALPRNDSGWRSQSKEDGSKAASVGGLFI